MDGTHKYRICETNSNKVITSRGVVFTSLRHNKQLRGPEIVQVPDSDIIETTEMPVSKQRQLLQLSRIQQETLRPIPDNIDDDDPLNLQPLDERHRSTSLFSACSPCKHNSTTIISTSPSLWRVGAVGAMQEELAKMDESKVWEVVPRSHDMRVDVGCILERLMGKPANHRHTKLDGLPKDSVKSRELISTSTQRLNSGPLHLSTISTLNAIRTISKRLSSMATLRRQSILHHQKAAWTSRILPWLQHLSRSTGTQASFISTNITLRQYLTDLTWLIAILHGVLFHRFRPIQLRMKNTRHDTVHIPRQLALSSMRPL